MNSPEQLGNLKDYVGDNVRAVNGLRGQTENSFEHDVERRIYVGIEKTRTTFLNFTFPPLCTAPPVFSMHESTREWLKCQNYQPIGDSHTGHYRVFVDGSGGKPAAGLEGASFGFCPVFSPTKDGPRLLAGFLGGLVVTSAMHPHFLGALINTNNTAELSGMVWVLLYVFYHSLRVP